MRVGEESEDDTASAGRGRESGRPVGGGGEEEQEEKDGVESVGRIGRMGLLGSAAFL